MTALPWSPAELRSTLLERTPTLVEATVNDALALLAIPYERRIWYSENAPEAPPERALACLEAWQSIATAIEPLLITAEPTYAYDWHALDRLIVASQFLWHWYDLHEAEPLIERAAHLASTAMTPDGVLLVSRNQLRREVDDGFLGEAYLSSRFYHTSWFYLGEIAEARNDPEAALGWYERFLFAEPEFAPLEVLARNKAFYDLRRYVPNTVEACRRGGLCAERTRRFARARELYEVGASLRMTRFSPLRERAALRLAEGRKEEALLDELAYLDGVVIAYGADAEELGDAFKRYLELCERFVVEGSAAMARHCRWRAVAFVRTTFVLRDNYNYGDRVRLTRTVPGEIRKRLKEQAGVAERAGDATLAHAFAELDFELTLADALAPRGERAHVAAIEAYMEGLRRDGSRAAVRSACETIELRIEQSLVGPTPERVSRPAIADDLAILASLYGEASGEKPGPEFRST